MSDTPVQILDATGNPLALSSDTQQVEVVRAKQAVVKAYASYVSSLQNLTQLPMLRAQEPLENHAWVYAAAMAIAMNISQAPFTIYNETQAGITRRKEATLRAGRKWSGCKAGKRRTAIQRHLLNQSRFKGAKLRGAEADYEHPLALVLNNANEYTTAAQLWQATCLWMSLRGECYWLKVTESGAPIMPGDMPYEIWVLGVDDIRPVYVQKQHVGWKYQPRKGENFTNKHEMYLEKWELIHFKFINPNDPIRGLAPIIPAAGNIKLDLLALSHNQSVIENGADPGGILTNKEGMDDVEEQEFLQRWNQRHQGPRNRRKMNVLTGDWKYIPTGLTPAELDYGGASDRNRDTVLGALRTPKTVVGVTDALNYATQMGQDKNFWDKTCLPMIRYFETVMDRELLFSETDNVFGAFDLSNIEALRQGLDDQVETAIKLSSEKLHMPPALAFEKVGLDVEEYPGSDICLVNPLLAPVDDVINNRINQSSGTTDGDTGKSGVSELISRALKASRVNLWKRFIAQCHEPAEILAGRAWTRAINEMREMNLTIIDDRFKNKVSKTGLIVKEYNVEEMLLDIEEMQGVLGNRMRPTYFKALTLALEYTVEEVGGVAIFDISSPEIIKYNDKVQSTLLGTAPKTIQKSVKSSLLDGISNGETLGQLRDRVSEVYNISNSHYKTLQVARTETTKFISGQRDIMHTLQGIEKGDWLSAGDEATRDHHLTFGAVGPQPMDFNYLELVGGVGILTHPGDMRAPAKEVINCRCAKIAVL